MARLVLTLTALAAAPLFAEPTPDAPKPSPTAAPEKERPPKHDEGGRPRFDEAMMEKFRAKLEKMSPEERQKFKENFKRWKEMGDDERRDWQKRAMEEHERLRRNVDEALAKLGLTLDKDQREVFMLRYKQERRKLEQSLCREMDEKRKAGVEAILQKLKAEFSGAAKPGASPTPAPTGTP
jgi:hypothetical protein